MKKMLSILSFLILVISCTTPDQVVRSSENFTNIDFTSYAQKGFLISPYVYDGQYESIGVINFEYYPKSELKLIKPNPDDDVKINVSYKKWIPDLINFDDQLNKVYEECVSMGADAIVDFKVSSIEKTYDTKPVLTVNGILLTGFAIKRK